MKDSLCSLLTVLSSREFLAFEYGIPGLAVSQFKVSLKSAISDYRSSSALAWFLPYVPRSGAFSLCPPLNSAYFTVFRLNPPLPVFSFVFCSPWSSLGSFIPVNLWGGTGLSMWDTSMAPILRMKGGEKSNLLSCQLVMNQGNARDINHVLVIVIPFRPFVFLFLYTLKCR